MGLHSCGSPNFGDFKIPNLWILGQNDIWVQALWPSTKNTIKGKVVASPKFGPWWVLWICVYSWLVYALKVFQLCTNQLIVWFVQVHVNNWFNCHSSWSKSRSSNTPFYPRSVVNQGMYPNSLSFRCFHLRFVVESIKELEGAWG